jgi:hypothetical protein
MLELHSTLQERVLKVLADLLIKPEQLADPDRRWYVANYMSAELDPYDDLPEPWETITDIVRPLALFGAVTAVWKLFIDTDTKIANLERQLERPKLPPRARKAKRLKLALLKSAEAIKKQPTRGPVVPLPS